MNSSMKKLVTILGVVLVTVAVCSFALADAPRGFIGDIGVGWNTSNAVAVRASSTHPACVPSNTTKAVNLLADGLTQQPDGTGGVRANWFTDGALLPSANPQRGGTVVGGAWIEYTLEKAYPINEMWIWNANESSTYAGYGIKTCTIEYSLTGGTDPAEWTVIYAGDIPKTTFDASGNSTVDLKVPFSGAEAKYIVVTTAVEPNQNWDNGSHNDTGLAQVRFYGTDAYVPAPRGYIGDDSATWDTSSKVTATASSFHPVLVPLFAVNGSGLFGEGSTSFWFRTDPTASNFTSSTYDNSIANPRGGTVLGGHWIQFAFDQVYPINEMWIWNDCEPTWHIQGFKTVTIQYSTTGSTNEADWTTIYQGDIPDEPITPTAKQPTLVLPFAGANAKYVVITTAVAPDQNYTGGGNGDGALNEVRFYPNAVVTHNLTGSVALGNYGGNLDMAPVSFELKKGDGTVVETKSMKSGDAFTYNGLIAGDYVVTVKGAYWLTKVVNVTLDADKDLGAITLPGGDLNGDGSVGLLDLGILKQSWGQHS